MEPIQIALFANENQEYVVIITGGIDPNEYKEPGYVIVDQVELDVDARLFNLFPTDRPLRSDD